jgi:hypothetical protein
MRWFHTLALPLATTFALYRSVKMRAPAWKYAALVLGCALMVGGLWIADDWATVALVCGGVVFVVAIPRGRLAREASPGVEHAPFRTGELGDADVRITFTGPGFFLNDGARVILLLDGAIVHECSFRQGFDVVIPVAPGPHGLEAVIEFGFAKRQRSWDIVVPPSGCDVALEYGRFRGNFTKDAHIVPRAAGSEAVGA